ncbi:hypothetical protein CYLTODRAFT_457223 [Cylindrobasidium torrendii FP15055 ss-10]|uniref:Uncharacterized protein n=1 Tax=Cylindrobasidium torrendii FP15055 ss-10 TaxID=1314674 RepID=A0A0D7B2J1_9AGAR|nr:hypothetical protein CYLTODRAFT_457223 [Cylindrobasidium torrendii FP15055 ss-10]
MKSFAAFVLCASVAFAAPSFNNATISARQTNNANKPECGGAGDATLADCQHLFDNWPYYQDATWDATCHSGTTLEYNPACYGNCCVYTSWNTPLWEDVHSAVGQILGCKSEEKGTVNGRVEVTDSGTICMADRDACGDCFDSD